MAFNQATAIDRLGLTAPTPDELTMIDSALLTSIQLAETFCDRGLAFRTDHVENHLCQHSSTLSSWLYPVASIASVTADDASVVPDYELDETNGVLFFKSGVYKLRLTTTVTGGYQLDAGGPPDLELALWQIFEQVWNNLSATLGGAGSSSGAAVKTIRAGDLSISYDTGSSAAIASGSAAAGGLIPAGAYAILMLYKRETS